MTDRINIIDWLKGVAIFLVVYGHGIQYSSGKQFLITNSFFDNIVFKLIYSFHMPLFMLISGYLFYNKHSKSLSVKKQLKTLVIPIFVWRSLYGLSYFVFKSNKISFIKYWYISVIYGLWFLWAIFYSSVVIIFVEYFIKNKNMRILIYILGFIFSLIIPDYLGSSLYKFMYPFYLLGYYNKSFLTKIKNLKTYVYIIYLIILLSSYILFFRFYNYNSYIYTSGYYIFNNKVSYIYQLYTDIQRFLIGLIGSLLMIFLVNLLNYIKKITLF